MLLMNRKFKEFTLLLNTAETFNDYKKVIYEADKLDLAYAKTVRKDYIDLNFSKYGRIRLERKYCKFFDELGQYLKSL